MRIGRRLKIIAEEPFRVFFPLALLVTVAGVALWPLFHGKVLGLYPGVPHARVMAVGLSGFLLGFLGTAFPRLVEAPPLRGPEVLVLLVSWLVSAVLHLGNRTAAGDAVFTATVGFLVLLLVARWIFLAKDSPPPGAPVALLGMLAGGAGSAALAWKHGLWMSPAGYQFAKLLLFQALFLLPLIGVGPYLLPRLFGHASRDRLEDSRPPPPGWWPRFLGALLAGVVILFSLGMEAWGAARAGTALRALAVLGAFLLLTPVFKKARVLTTCGSVVRWSVVLLVVALGWVAIQPGYRVGILHLFFVSGIGMVMLGVGTRVVLGHANRHDLLEKRMVWLWVVAGLAVLGAATRVSADFIPKIRVSHLNYAAITWAVIVGIWLWKLRHAFLAGDPEERTSRCPKARGRSEAEAVAPKD